MTPNVVLVVVAAACILFASEVQACSENRTLDFLGRGLCVCVGGFEEVQSVCQECPVDTYRPGPLGNNPCGSCNEGSTTLGNTGALACECIPGWSRKDYFDCDVCEIGTYMDHYNRQQGCDSCGVGLTTLSTESDSFSDCGIIPGYYYSAGVATACAVGEYSSLTFTTHTSCTSCSAHSTTTGTASTSINDCVCEPGYTLSGGVCTSCAEGTFKDSASDAACTACPAGTTSAAGSTSSSDCGCASGSVLIDGACGTCSSGTYYNAATESCDSCPDHTTTVVSSATSVDQCVCVAGAGLETGETSCTLCTIGSYKSFIGSSPCEECSGGVGEYITLATGSTASTDCLCPAGTHQNVDVCVSCDDGYTTEANLFSECTPCPDFSSTGPNSSSTSASDCVCDNGFTANSTTGVCECPAGTFNSGSLCEECPADSFSVSAGSTSCTVCPTNTSTDSATGSSTADACVCGSTFVVDAVSGACQCPAGTYVTSSGCVSCSVGFFSEYADSPSCTVCPVNSSTTANGSTSSSDCVCDETYVADAVSGDCQCPVGTYVTVSGCLECEVGFFSDAEDSVVCSSCPANSSTGATGSTSSDQCVCNATYSTDSTTGTCFCPAGSVDAESGCFECEADSFSSTIDSTVCTACPVNSSTGTATGSTSSDACVCDSTYVANVVTGVCECPVGTYVTVSGCVACGADSFSDVSNSASCSLCPANTTTNSATGSTSDNDCLCVAGFSPASVGDSSCVSCPIGTFKSTIGDSSCESCPFGSSTSAPSSTSATECLCVPGKTLSTTGECVDCSPDSFSAELSNEACESCPSTTTTDGVSGASSTVSCGCEAGFEAVDGVSCTACPVGTFKAFWGSSETCVSCADNASTTATASVSEDSCLCVAGFSLDASGVCSECAADSFSVDLSNDECVACGDLGTTNGVLGSISAAACSCLPGSTFDSASNSCAECSIGSYKGSWGDEACIPCPGTTSTVIIGATSVAECDACSLGQTFDDATASCVYCPANTYSNTVSNDACVACPNGATTNGLIGSVSQDACGCEAGFTATSTGSCEVCPVASYKADFGNHSCESCPVNTSSTSTGATSVAVCECVAGFALDSVTSVCVECPADTFSPELGNAACAACPSNSGTNGVEGAASASVCGCLAGFGGSSSSSLCTECPVGTYKADFGSTVCSSCPSGSTTTTTGNVSSGLCLCGLGKTLSSSGVCVDCAAGTFSDSVTNGSCSSCPATTSSPAGSDDLADCVCVDGRVLVLAGTCIEHGVTLTEDTCLCPTGEGWDSDSSSCEECEGSGTGRNFEVDIFDFECEENCDLYRYWYQRAWCRIKRYRHRRWHSKGISH